MVNEIGIFRDDIFQAGGIETWIYNVAARWGRTYNITVYYGKADKHQLARLSKLVRCVQYVGQNIKLNTAIFCYDFMGIDTVTAKKKIHIVHADYRFHYNFPVNKHFAQECDEVYAVSKRAQKAAQKILPVDVGLLYNPLIYDKAPRPVKIMSPTRLSWEKGLERMVKLNKALDKSGLDYVWDIYTPKMYQDKKIRSRFSNNVRFRKPTMKILSKMKDYDFLVQLSSSEAFGYAPMEALMSRLKIVVTDIPVFRELGISRDNAIIVPTRKHFVNYDKIVKKIIKQSPFVPPDSSYEKILGKPCPGGAGRSIVIQNKTEYEWLVESTGVWLEPKQFTAVDELPPGNWYKIIK